MGNAKKLKLSFEELIKIAKELNKNILDNRTRSKEDRISNDHFIRQKFNISRKDFSFTCKDYGIVYNQTTFMYDVPDGNVKVIPNNCLVSEKEIAAANEHHKSNATKNIKNNVSLKDIDNTGHIEALLLQLIDMMKDKQPGIQSKGVELSTSIVNISSKYTKDDIESHCEKVYEPIYVEFKRVCESYTEFYNRDLFSLALLEFVEKYKKH